ncbi:serine hydrolase [Sphingomicrobium arenosum]|uniref:serine hydrolase n=1 Tax=Sphingomicrobium arenosum TaxID=2233861 RepID=UPI00223F580C|nr:serine hydrolase [Sphingomicrobium arenosum]
MVRAWMTVAALAMAVPSAGCTETREAAAFAIAGDPATELERYREAGVLNGAVLIGKGDKILYAAGHGLGGVDGEPLTADHRFRIASVSKQFTVAAALKLAEQGKLSLDDVITDHLPYYEPAAGNRITIAQLMAHDSGIDRRAGRRADVRVLKVEDPEPHIRRIMSDPLRGEPGAAARGEGQSHYSNANYWILGAIIEEASGLSYKEAVRTLLLDPLGLDETSLPEADEPIAMEARGMAPTVLGWEAADYMDDHGAPYAAGMIVSTVGDLFRWTRALHGGEVFEDPAMLTVMTEPAEPWVDSDWYGKVATGRGLFRAERANGRTFIYHDGHIGPYYSDLRYFPQSDITTVVLINGDEMDGSMAVTHVSDALESLAHGEPVAPPEASLWRRAAMALRTGADDEATQLAGEMDEGSINWMAYQFLGRGRPDEAIALLERGIEAHPQSANMRDSYGEALWHAGRDADAIAAYRSALALDPNLENASAMIARIEAGERP